MGMPGPTSTRVLAPAESDTKGARSAILRGLASQRSAVGLAEIIRDRDQRRPTASAHVALDRNELGALLVAAGLGPPPEHALISLLALNGLRVSEAAGADIEQLGLEGGHRTLTITRKVVIIPLAPRTARAIDLAIGNGLTDRCSWLRTGGGWTGTAPGGSSGRSPAAPGSPRPSRPTRSGTRSSPPRSMPGFRCATSKRPPHMRTRDHDAV